MDTRLLEIVLPENVHNEVKAMIADAGTIDTWHEPALDGRVIVRVLAEASRCEPILDMMQKHFSHLRDFRAVILQVEATVPSPPEPGLEPKAEDPGKLTPLPGRISREELLSDLNSGTRVTKTFLATVVLSSIVAGVGLLRDNVAVVIGAMVIAPLLTPNMALALATTLGDLELARKAIRTNASGMLLALALAVVAGVLVPVDQSSAEFTTRTSASFADTVLALASGTAGALAFTSGVPAGLVGVMVAVALLPPLVVAGMSLGAGRLADSYGAFLLLATNIICVNLAAVATFLVQGLRPRTWWEADKAKRRSRRALLMWIVLLVLLVALITLSA